MQEFVLDIVIVRRILPKHYICSEVSGGVHCYSDEGIADDEQWRYTVKAFKQNFTERFLEVFHQINYNHKKFTVFLTKQS